MRVRLINGPYVTGTAGKLVDTGTVRVHWDDEQITDCKIVALEFIGEDNDR